MRSPILTAVLMLGLMSFLVLGGIFLLRGAGQSTPEDLLPADTLLLVESRDVPRLWRALSRTRLGSDGADGWPSPLGETIGRELEALGLPLVPEDADRPMVISGETLLALVPAGGSGADGGGTEPVLMLRAGRASGYALDSIGRALRTRLDSLGGVWGAREHRGREYETLGIAGSRRTFAFAAIRGVAIVTESTRLMRRLIDTVDGAGPSLADDADYREMRRRMDPRAELLAYASREWVVTSLFAARGSTPRSRRLARLMGLDAVKAVGLEMDLSKGLFQERLFALMGPGRRGLPGKLFDDAPRAVRDVGLPVEGFPFHVSLTFSSLDALYDRLPVILGEAMGAPPDSIRQRLAGFEELLAIDPERDLLTAFGERATVSFGGASVYPRGASNRLLQNLPAVIAVETRSGRTLSEALRRLDGLGRMLGAYRDERLPDGTRLTWYEVPSLAPLRPAWALGRDRLLAATSPGLLRRLESGDPERARSEATSALLKRLPRRAHLVFVGDSARLLDLVGSGTRLPEPLERRLALLRSDPELPPTAITVTMSAAGLQLDGIAPISPSLLLVMIAAHTADTPVP